MDSRLSKYSTTPSTYRAYLGQQGQQLLDSIKNHPDFTAIPLPTPQNDLQAPQSAPSAQMATGPQKTILGAPAPLTQAFGNQNPGVEVFSHGINSGADFGAPVGTSVALPPGQWKILSAFNSDTTPGHVGDNTDSGYGNSVYAQNAQTGEKLRLSHLSQVGVQPGQMIDGGNIIGATGATGNVTGPHLDLEYYDAMGKLADILKSQYGQYLSPGGQGGGGTGGQGGGNPFAAAGNYIKNGLGHVVQGMQGLPDGTQPGQPETFGHMLGTYAAGFTPEGAGMDVAKTAFSDAVKAVPAAERLASALPFVAGAVGSGAPESMGVHVSSVPGITYRPIDSLIAHEGAPDAQRIAMNVALAKQGGELPPLLTTKEGDAFGVLDGAHRLEAFRQLGQKFVPTIDMGKTNPETLNAYNQVLDAAHTKMKTLGKRTRAN